MTTESLLAEKPELTDLLWDGERSVFFPKINKQVEDLLEEASSYPNSCACDRCQNAHFLATLDRFAWPADKYNCYFGPVHGYQSPQDTCPVIYLPEAVYQGLGLAIQSDLNQRGHDITFPEHPNIQPITSDAH